MHVVVEGRPELLQGQKEFPCHRPPPAGVVEEHPQDLGDQLWQVDFELRAQRHGYVLHQQDDGGLEGGVDAPEVLDQVEDGVKVVPDVLLDHIDQAAQLLAKAAMVTRSFLFYWLFTIQEDQCRVCVFKKHINQGLRH